MIRILSADDHPLLREGIAVSVRSEAFMELAAEASDGREALEVFRMHRPDITLMDLQMLEMSGILHGDILAPKRGHPKDDPQLTVAE